MEPQISKKTVVDEEKKVVDNLPKKPGCPGPSEVKEFSAQFSQEDWAFLCDLDLFLYLIMRNLDVALEFARLALLGKRLEQEESMLTPKRIVLQRFRGRR